MLRLTHYFSKANLERFFRYNHIVRMALFGSVLTDELKPDSDIDILVEFYKSQMLGLFEIAGMEIALSETFDRRVDLRRCFKNEVVRTTEVHYEERVKSK